MSINHAWTAGPISTKFCEDLHTNSRKFQVWPCQPNPLPSEKPKLQNLSRSLEEKLALQKMSLGPGLRDMKCHPWFKTDNPIRFRFQFRAFDHERTSKGQLRNFSGPLSPLGPGLLRKGILKISHQNPDVSWAYQVFFSHISRVLLENEVVNGLQGSKLRTGEWGGCRVDSLLDLLCITSKIYIIFLTFFSTPYRFFYHSKHSFGWELFSSWATSGSKVAGPGYERHTLRFPAWCHEHSAITLFMGNTRLQLASFLL